MAFSFSLTPFKLFRMRYFIGIHTESTGTKTTAVAVATEASLVIPEKYSDREPWEIRKLLPGTAQAQHADPSTAINAAIQRLYEKMFVSNFIPNPKNCVPPVTIYLPSELIPIAKLPGRVVTTPEKHWTNALAKKVRK